MDLPSALQHPIQGSDPKSIIRDTHGQQDVVSSLQPRPFLFISRCSPRGHLSPCLQSSHLATEWSKFTSLTRQTCKLLSLQSPSWVYQKHQASEARFFSHLDNFQGILETESQRCPAAAGWSLFTHHRDASIREGLLLPPLPEMQVFLSSERTTWQKRLN